jgi:type VI protein secretion system component VasK
VSWSVARVQRRHAKGESMRRTIYLGVLLAVVIGTAMIASEASQLYAQGDEVSQLRQRVAELEQKVKELEALLKECNEAPKSGQNDDYGWRNKKNWRNLVVGMKEDQVRNILGEPVKVIKGVKTLWYYPNFYGGYVSFDETGKLTGWNEP